ncbi:MAG: eukaryotic-like serine/threonine-protein kinase [Thermoleophilaceae bacterium]|nr:eukaryotic-like serine/threonine-protein kinase [Thermoleophilaceae bacterium]
MSSMPARVADRYTLERRLGAGGMSTVFLARDDVLEREVAVKLLAEHLADDEAFVARFRREALAAARLQHPNVVQVYDSGRDAESDRHFIVMEYVEGPSCADLLRDRGLLEIDQAVRIVTDACNGLDYAHRAGVVHRDVKPGNLLISSDSGATKLADFGIAKATEQTRITQVGSVLGTAAYLSPEQAHGQEAGPASDIYSLGVCAYQFLTGRLPHEYSSLTELALKQQQNPVVPVAEWRPEVPPALDRAVRVCLETDPANRYPDALQCAKAISAGLSGEYTDATMRLATAEMQATRAIPATEGTRVMPQAPIYDTRSHPPTVAPKKKKRWGARILVAIAVLAAGAVVAFAAIEAANPTIKDIAAKKFEQQIQQLDQFIRDHAQ